MLKDHANVMGLFLQAGEIIGRKKLQKMIYIAKKLNAPFSEKYTFHMFGPYSEELSLRMEELCNLGFVVERKEDKGHYVQYRYTLSTEGERFLGMYPNQSLSKELVEALNDKSSRFLELVSTLLYFEDLDMAEQKEKVHTLKAKQNYSDEELDEAYTYIHMLRGLLS
ncbi:MULTISPECIES: YwgA family protein [Halalkalibacter]|uniref:YwgA family protein n=1 Tax=Halalkalibacter hemicellulosilyticusJCM 9152 TaxID=1236971 RepID=W4QGM4_9BACI|nr:MULTISPECIES: hypothetical protein [Halalkalibacter]MCK0470001.1 YwgA family protein [Halalkalibacter sp. APA_J-10(15)]GAE31265.1 hypothetical protein JCM9152_2722 [Halalkalibacter hemicellulosilyticusJCM 9152]